MRRSSESVQPPAALRRPEIDLMRAFVVLGVVVLHSALVFGTSAWRIQNAETSVGFDVFIVWGLLWGMPLLFVVSGTAAWHALGKRTAGGFVRERLQRLLVPCVFGLLALVPPMWYLSRLRVPDFHESYGQFWLRFMDVPAIAAGLLTGGRWRAGTDVFDPMHMWFLYVLLVLSLLLLPLFLYLRGDRGRRVVEKVVVLADRRPFTLLIAGAVPFALLELAFGPSAVTGGWAWPAYGVPLAFGYVQAADRRFDRLLGRVRWRALLLAVLTTVAAFCWLGLLGPASGDAFEGRVAGWGGLQAVAGWAWILAILGFASSLVARFGRPSSHKSDPGPRPAISRLGQYVGEAVLPVYVIHEPVIVAVAFVLVGWPAPTLVKYPALVLASLAVTLAAYEVLVRRLLPMRVLLGMKPTRDLRIPRSRN